MASGQPGGPEGVAEHDGAPAFEIPGLVFPECPRWHQGRFWISDQLGGRVLVLNDDGGFEEVATLSRPSGLGFEADGSVLVARMDEPQVMRIDGSGEIQTAVDAGALGVKLNDMIRDAKGRLYIDAYPADGDDVGRSSIVMVDLDGSASIAADGLSFPNGLALTADQRTLLVAETKGARISAWSIADDGTLFDHRVWAETPGLGPDGICLDAEGALWIGCPWANKAVRMAEGGEILDTIAFPGRWVTACALGGEDGRTLLLTTTILGPGGYAAGEADGFVETRRVDVPGVDWARGDGVPIDEGDDQ